MQKERSRSKRKRVTSRYFYESDDQFRETATLRALAQNKAAEVHGKREMLRKIY